MAVGVASLAGCSRPETAADRHAADMREAIDEIQEDQDKAASKLADYGTPPPKASSAQAKAPPANRTVQLGEGETASDDPNDPSARPQISLSGPPGAASRSRSSRSGSARIEPSSSEDSGRKEPSVLDPDAKKAYEGALKLIHDKQHAKGIDALNAFMVKWPDHPYIENATYWKGEALYAQGEYQKAAEQFEAVVSRWSIGTKAPDALLKAGMCHEKLGQSSKAQELWEKLKREYPKSEAVRKIPAENDRKTRGPKETR